MIGKYFNKAFLNISFSVSVILIACVALTSETDNTIQVNYSVKTGTTSGLMFGGNNYGFSTQTISDAHKKAGFNVARYDALINEIVPATTIDDYKRNVLGVQDPKTWNWKRIDRDLNMLHTSGIKVLLIINYCPLWLASKKQAEKKNINTIPVNWNIYEDIVKKVYEHVKPHVFAIEVWNEPDTGLKIDGTSYQDAITAYTDLYYHTAKPIRTINPTIKIGGPAVADTYDTKFFNALLDDKRLRDYFNFYSYHFYGVQKAGNISSLKSLATSKGRPNFPIYITEWNYSAEFNKNPMNTNAIEAISFVGNTLIDQFKESPSLSILYCMDDYSKADNFFTMDANGTMVPKVSVIKLMSVNLGLGTGTNSIVKTAYSGSVNGVGAINYLGKQIVCLANVSENNKLVNINFYKTGNTGKKTVNVYLAAEGKYGNALYKTIPVIFKNGNATINKFEIPGHAVVGLKVN